MIWDHKTFNNGEEVKKGIGKYRMKKKRVKKIMLKDKKILKKNNRINDYARRKTMVIVSNFDGVSLRSQ